MARTDSRRLVTRFVNVLRGASRRFLRKKALSQQISIFFNIFQHVFNIFSTCFQHCFQRVGNTLQRVFNMRTWSCIRSISRIFPEICRWGAFENPQKSVNRPDPTFTHRFHGYSPKMRSGVWIRPISRFFRKFADGERTKIRKIVRVPPPRLGREARHATTQRAPKIGREPPRDDPKGT